MSDPKPTGWARAAVLVPALIVGGAAVAATAHGGYEVAAASGVPEGLIAALYPVITDGLALVAYASTHRLTGLARGYAWAVVVVAAALSGLAQAVYLVTGPGLVAPEAIRFGVGAWPAAAGAVAAHLVFLLAQKRPALATQDEPAVDTATARQVIAPPPPVPAASGAERPPVVERPPLRIAAAKVTEPTVRVVVEPEEKSEPHAVDGLTGATLLLAKARELLAAGAGRTILMRELGLKDNQAKVLLKASSAEVPTLLARYAEANA